MPKSRTSIMHGVVQRTSSIVDIGATSVDCAKELMFFSLDPLSALMSADIGNFNSLQAGAYHFLLHAPPDIRAWVEGRLKVTSQVDTDRICNQLMASCTERSYESQKSGAP